MSRVVLGTLLWGLGAGASAQEETEADRVQRAERDQIVVTAQRREERLVDVPISVTAIGQLEADRRSIATIEDIARITPNLNLTLEGDNNIRVAIRGVDSDAGAGTTGIYINDVPIQVRQIGFNARDVFPLVFDLQRVEVLRGPQGTLFGAGSMGGTLRFITPEASLTEYSMYARSVASATKGGAPSFEVGIGGGGPIVEDKLGFRVSAWGSHSGGWIDRVSERTDVPGTFNLEDDNANSRDSWIARAELKWAPTPDLQISPSIFIQNQEINDTNVIWLEDTGPAPLTSSFEGAYTAPLVFSDFDESEFRGGEPTQQVANDRFYLPSIKVQYDTPWARLVAIGSYYDREQTIADDFTTFDQVLFTGVINGVITGVSPFGFSRPVLPGQQATSFDTNSQENYSFEARLESDPDKFGRLSWLAGVFYSENEQTAIQQVEDLFLGEILNQQFIDLGGPGFGPDPIEGFFGIPLVDDRFIFDNLEVAEDKQLAGFVQVDLDVTDSITLTGGLRVSDTEFSIFNEVVGPVLGPFNTDNVSQSETPVTPRAAISWKAADDQLFYASASKGFRIGGANAAVGLPCGITDGDTPIPGTALGLLGLTDRPVAFDSDSLWSYEVGVKNSLLGGRLQTQVAGYHIDWSNIQQNFQLPACAFRYFDNAGSADIDGFEIAATLDVTENFFISTSIGYTDAEFAETVFATPEAQASGALPIVTEGDKVPVPPLTVNVVGQYSFVNPLGHDSYIRVDWDRTSSPEDLAIQNPANAGFDPRFTPNPTTNFVNMRVGVEVLDGVELSAFATNLLDSAPVLDRAFQPNGTLIRAQTFRPRTVGLQAIQRF
ncbi:MAG: TonB-dependent receptor [Caulobacterales bacterium]|nr:TonB-dependent receptor [Caulobacterales bacterium]